MSSDVDIDSLRRWVGRTENQLDQVAGPAVHRLAALLDRDDPLPQAGDPLPPGWHGILFPRVAAQSELGSDGHPRRGDFLPPVPLPRRMFAGRRTSFLAPLRVGDEVRKESTIASVEPKTGRSGPMIFVTVRSSIVTPRGPAIDEEQDIVYRAEAGTVSAGGEAGGVPAGQKAGAVPAAPAAAAPFRPAVWSASITPDEVMLFRYSALCYNGHRIHYDHPYATGVEGYPGLVVNGGLATLFLYELARRHAGRPLIAMQSRNLSALFAGRPIRLEGVPDPDGRGAELRALAPDGAVAVAARAGFA